MKINNVNIPNSKTGDINIGNETKNYHIRSYSSEHIEKRDKKEYNNQKFQILQAKLNSQTENTIDYTHAYAWKNNIYPFFEDNCEWHKGFEECFKIKKETISKIIEFIDE